MNIDKKISSLYLIANKLITSFRGSTRLGLNFGDRTISIEPDLFHSIVSNGMKEIDKEFLHELLKDFISGMSTIVNEHLTLSISNISLLDDNPFRYIVDIRDNCDGNVFKFLPTYYHISKFIVSNHLIYEKYPELLLGNSSSKRSETIHNRIVRNWDNSTLPWVELYSPPSYKKADRVYLFFQRNENIETQIKHFKSYTYTNILQNEKSPIRLTIENMLRFGYNTMMEKKMITSLAESHY